MSDCKTLLLVLIFAGFCHADGWMLRDSAAVSQAAQTVPQSVQKKWQFRAGKLVQAEFSGPGLRQGEILFRMLDSLNGNGVWSEIDMQGYLEPTLRKHLSGARQAWFSLHPGQPPVLAVLRGKDAGLLALVVDDYAVVPPVPLEYRYRGDQAVFADFESYPPGKNCNAQSACNLIHMENPDLQVVVEKRHVRMGYRNPDATRLTFPRDFARLDDRAQKAVVLEFQDFFRNELAVMLRAFVHTTPGMFNWQPWHWTSFGEPGLISTQELHAIFRSGHVPSLYTILKLPCKGGETVRFDTDGNGMFYMEVQ